MSPKSLQLFFWGGGFRTKGALSLFDAGTKTRVNLKKGLYTHYTRAAPHGNCHRPMGRSRMWAAGELYCNPVQYLGTRSEGWGGDFTPTSTDQPLTSRQTATYSQVRADRAHDWDHYTLYGTTPQSMRPDPPPATRTERATFVIGHHFMIITPTF
ncbi:hypothetical protein BGW80DRAFT_840444 [Lactifluus volemus]|nr:hypothetical protein BGW80DRAFT_840444 [Lactifluus volemus]